jgi:hypothetical protein
VAAELGQSELLAVVGAEFDGHGALVLVVGCGHEKSQTVNGLA